MFNLLEEIFNEIGYGDLYFRQGSFGEDAEIPPKYFAFWNNGSILDSHYDNNNHSSVWTWTIYFYSNDPKLIYSELDKFLEKAKSKGFVISDEGYDIPSDLPNYFGRMTRIEYIKLLP